MNLTSFDCMKILPLSSSSSSSSLTPATFSLVDYPVKDSGEKLTREEKSFYRSSKRYLQKEKLSSFESFCKFICSKFKKISYEFAIFTYKHFFKKLGENEPDLIETCNQKIQDCEDQHIYKLFLKIIGKVEKQDLEILKLNEECIREWPWTIDSISEIVTSEKLIRDSFEMVELEEISNISRSIINSSDYQPVINKQNMKELVNHFKYLRKNQEYIEQDHELNEGTWEDHCISIPFNISSRGIPKLKLIMSEKASRSSKRRRNEVSSDDSKENHIVEKKRKKQGKRPDVIFVSRKSIKPDVKFEFLVGEVCSQPWNEKEDKMNGDTRKLFRLMKDCYDSIALYFYEKFGTNYSSCWNLKNLEIYGIIVSGFEIIIYVLDQPGFGVYRIRKVVKLEIPVKEENNDYYLYINKLMFAINEMEKLVENLNSELSKKSSKKNEKDFLISSL
ncbi:15141_t:CDS:10, partial [Entrophospora sp. SA101]